MALRLPLRARSGLLLASLAVVACGSKGPPLAPLRLAPSKTEGLSAIRVQGGPITLQFTVPATNAGGSVPPDIASIRVFAITKPAGDPPPTAADLAGGDLRIATIAVETATPASTLGTDVLPPAPPALQPGAVITWEDSAEAATVYPTPMMRYYAVAGVSRRGRVGVPSDVVAVPLVAVPDPPSKLSVTFTEKVIRLDWLGVSPATRYRVYEVGEGRVAAAPLNREPIAGTTFDDPRPEFGTERCYIVRSAIASAGASIESAAAGPMCITPRDIFPPPPPAGLTAVAGTGAVSLIWDAVDAADLAGYLVLRAEAPGEKLLPLFDIPITETTYKDATTTAGTRYVYAVVAVDKTTPPNRSAESNRVEETGRN
ncbi:MAG: hypothetical protein WD690_19455 [Vicinamibacterales bacterium]